MSVETLVLLWTIDAREEITVSVEALILSWTINAREKRDIPGALKQADMDETLHDHVDESLDGSLPFK